MTMPAYELPLVMVVSITQSMTHIPICVISVSGQSLSHYSIISS